MGYRRGTCATFGHEGSQGGRRRPPGGPRSRTRATAGTRRLRRHRWRIATIRKDGQFSSAYNLDGYTKVNAVKLIGTINASD